FKHLVLVKFKDDVVFDEIIEGMKTLVNDLTLVVSFIWGMDNESHEMLRQGFSHVFDMTFRNKEDFISFTSHPKHAEFSKTFSAAVEKAVLLDFPACTVKS
ncbi:hypothetical protein M569_16168, partial [Genlisea aurea]